jgi:hypothetical protein
MSRNIIFVLIHHRHKLLDPIDYILFERKVRVMVYTVTFYNFVQTKCNSIKRIINLTFKPGYLIQCSD